MHFAYRSVSAQRTRSKNRATTRRTLVACSGKRSHAPSAPETRQVAPACGRGFQREKCWEIVQESVPCRSRHLSTKLQRLCFKVSLLWFNWCVGVRVSVSLLLNITPKNRSHAFPQVFFSFPLSNRSSACFNPSFGLWLKNCHIYCWGFPTTIEWRHRFNPKCIFWFWICRLVDMYVCITSAVKCGTAELFTKMQ